MFSWKIRGGKMRWPVASDAKGTQRMPYRCDPRFLPSPLYTKRDKIMRKSLPDQSRWTARRPRIMIIYLFMLLRFSSPVIWAFHFGVVGAEWMIRIRKHLISYKSAVPPHAIKATTRKIKSLVGRSGAPILSGETRGEDRISSAKGFLRRQEEEEEAEAEQQNDASTWNVILTSLSQKSACC